MRAGASYPLIRIALSVLRACPSGIKITQIPHNHFYAHVVYAPGVLDLYTGSCGACFEVACLNASASYYPPAYGAPCSSASVVVQVVDSCPCVQPGNPKSNAHWCCGDMPHFDLSTQAFTQIAPLSLGFIYTKYRRVSCGVSGNFTILMDSYANIWWVAFRVKNAGNDGELGAVAVQEPVGGDGNWHAAFPTWGGTWAIDNSQIHAGIAFRLPLSVRITTRVSNITLVLPNVITSLTAPLGSVPGSWVFSSAGQLPDYPASAATPPTAAAIPPNLLLNLASFIYADALSPNWALSTVNGGSFDLSAGAGWGIGFGTAIVVAQVPNSSLMISSAVPFAAAGDLQLFVQGSGPTAMYPCADPSVLSATLQGSGSQALLEGITASVNAQRCLYGQVPPLTYDTALAAGASAYAQLCAGAGQLSAGAGGAYGETVGIATTAAAAVAQWMAEVSDYNFGFPGWKSTYLDFAQLVWLGSASLGCGVAWCPAYNATGAFNYVCRFTPAGSVKVSTRCYSGITFQSWPCARV